MKSGFRLASALLWLSQLGLSVAAPLLLFILGAVWLRDRCGWGQWVVAAGAILGVLGAAGGLISSLRSISRLSGEGEQKEKKNCFNDHD